MPPRLSETDVNTQGAFEVQPMCVYSLLGAQGVAAMVHESPFYGSRRPAAQKGSKLLRVSDLLTLGWVGLCVR